MVEKLAVEGLEVVEGEKEDEEVVEVVEGGKEEKDGHMIVRVSG